jgi:hypothetical protein
MVARWLVLAQQGLQNEGAGVGQIGDKVSAPLSQRPAPDTMER